MPRASVMVDQDHEIEAGAARGFWLGVLYAGIAGYLVVALGAGLYLDLAMLAITGPMRVVLGFAVVFAVANFVLRHRIVGLPPQFRLAVFCLWSALSFVLLAGLCMLDGGVASPLTVLFPVPMLYLAIGYPLALVIGNGFFGILCYGAVVAATPDAAAWPAVLVQSVGLLASWLVAGLGAINWARENQAMRVLRRQLRAAASTDELTGCLNQPAFAATLKNEIARARRYYHPIALLIIDIDNFKSINDQHGHLAGDSALRHVGSVLCAIARETDTTGRPGGDELALIAPEANRDAAVALAERLREQLATGLPPFSVTVSIGVCAELYVTDDADSMYHRADRALYAAKIGGRNRTVCSDAALAREHTFATETNAPHPALANAGAGPNGARLPAFEQQWQSCTQVRDGVDDGIANEQFFVAYHPIIDIASGRIVRVEALARWHHHVRGVIEPSLFIPVAERYGNIVALGRYILERAVAQAARWEREGNAVVVAVNVAALQISGTEIDATVAEVLATHGLSPHLLEIEITETALLPYLDHVDSPLDRLKELGVTLALDDFGTGYSSLNYLSRLPVDRIKIDRSFIARLDEPRDRAILENLVRMCRALALKVTAEGVETRDQAAVTRELGCDEWQGFYFGYPDTAERLDWPSRNVQRLA